jgi:hypothetical protein
LVHTKGIDDKSWRIRFILAEELGNICAKFVGPRSAEEEDDDEYDNVNIAHHMEFLKGKIVMADRILVI